MTAELRDLRAEISVTADQTLTAVAMARNLKKQDVVRLVLDEWAEKVIHEATLVHRLAGSDGKPRSAPE